MIEVFSVDPYLDREHRGDDYNCMHFARDVWKDLTGKDIGLRLKALHDPAEVRKARAGDLKAFEKLDRPISPCLALMRRPRTAPHIGIYLRRRILHLNENGVRFEMPYLAMLPFKTIGYYR